MYVYVRAIFGSTLWIFTVLLLGANPGFSQSGQHVYHPIYLKSSQFYTLSGKVFESGFHTDSVHIYVYREQVQGTVELVDSAFSVGKGGGYSFNGMIGGTYYLKARKASSVGSYIDTYYGESAAWITSKAIILRRDMTDRNIDLLIEGQASGIGQVSGEVTYGSTEINFPTGSGAAGIPVLLLNEGAVMRRTIVDANGFYSFGQVPLANYEVVVDFPGKSMAPFGVRMNSSKQQVDGVDFVIEKSLITTPFVSSVEPEPTLQDTRVYPNPFSKTISLRGYDKTVDFTLIDITGKMRSSGQLNSSESLDLTALEAGVYFLLLRKDGAQIVERIIKEE